MTELVTVASTSEIIQTQSTTISSTINTNQITKLPLTSRSAMDFVNFLPGVSTPGGNRDATINGLPQGVINITLDGINIQDNTLRSTDGFFAIVSPRLDAIEEVSVTTAGQGADAGQGAVQIKFVTRSGGNSYSGSGYHYYRSDKLNANTWFNNRDSAIDPETGKATKAKLKQNQTGVRFGGPLIIPGLVPRGKAFFFGNYEELSQPSEVTRTRTLLSTGGAGRQLTATAARPSTCWPWRPPTPRRRRPRLPTRRSPRCWPTSGRRPSAAAAINSRDANLDELRYGVPVESKRRFPTGACRLQHHRQPPRSPARSTTTGSPTAPDTLNDFEPQWPGFPAFGGQTSIRYGWSNSRPFDAWPQPRQRSAGRLQQLAGQVLQRDERRDVHRARSRTRRGST